MACSTCPVADLQPMQVTPTIDRCDRKVSMFSSSAALVLFESTDSFSVLSDGVNQEWLAVVHTVDGPRFELLARRYHLALNHLRSSPRRPDIPGRTELYAKSKKDAEQEMLRVLLQRKGVHHVDNTFVKPGPDLEDKTLPPALKDFNVEPPRLRALLCGPGRPPIDALCLTRAFLAAPLLGVADNPEAVHRLLHSNPTFARACGFLGPNAPKQGFELTSRQVPALSSCEEFEEVMTRYGLWHLARLEQVRDNIKSGVVEVEDTLSFDTTHVEGNSHCANVVPEQAQAADKVKHRKVPRMRKRCYCGKNNWDSCPHPWSPTDQGAAVVVKGPSRIYWAHKSSLAAFGNSEIPIDIRVLNYGAYPDGKTLLPHLGLLSTDLPQVVEELRHVLADSAYQENSEQLSAQFPKARLHVPIKLHKCAVGAIDNFKGIDRFTGTGVPICQADHRFDLRGRDISNGQFIWTAPDGPNAQPVCQQCPMAQGCLTKGNRRHIRVPRELLPQIDWNYPQHFTTERLHYAKRTGIERAIKRIKVDLKGEVLTHRDAQRVQAHLDRKLLTLHLLLAVRSDQ